MFMKKGENVNDNIEFHTPEEAKELKLIYLTDWCPECDIPYLIRMHDQVKNDFDRVAMVVQKDDKYAVAVDKVEKDYKY